MMESRFQRWSRKKAEARTEDQAAPPVTEPEISPEQQALVENEQLSEQELLAKYSLPNPDTIELGTDITGFMRAEIPEFLRRKALRSLWRSNPVLAVLDGLNDYDEDFTGLNDPVGGVRTLYKVGQGLIEKTKKLEEFVQEDSPEHASEVESEREPVVPPTVEDTRNPEPEALTAEAHEEIEPMLDPTPEFSEAEQPNEVRYRPRMRFEF